MDVNEFIMDELGCREHGRSKMNAQRDKIGRVRPDLGPMAGEISPNIMFFKNSQKGVRMDSHGCEMDSYGCGGLRGTRGQENKANRGTDGHAGRTCWVRYGRGNFPQKKYARTGIEGVRMGAAVAAAAEKIAATVEISSSSSNNSSNSNSRN